MSSTTENVATTVAEQPPRTGKYWIEDWRPEDDTFWKTGGAAVARRNLVFSVLSEHIGFSVWSLWSVLVLFMGPEYGIDAAGKFLLTALPTLVGAALRLTYTFAVATFGGRTWTIISALMLLIPTILIGIILEPGVSYTTLLIIAAFAGVGGGNFASSMANINAYYPAKYKGWALGINAGGGNLGVPVVQLVGLLVLATVGASHPRLMALIYIPLIVLAATGAALFMNNLTHASNAKGAMRRATKDPHTWIMSFLYIGTFGSFIGFGFAFGQVLVNTFKTSFPTAVSAAAVTFLGPLLGSLIRPFGGILADKFGGARVTFWNFLAMAISAGTVLLASTAAQSLPMFIIGFVLIFIFSGLGNGSTYKMIPAIFKAKAHHAVDTKGADELLALAEAQRLSNALIGIAGAIGAFGGVLVNLAFRQSFLTLKNGNGAYIAFIAFYFVCMFITWWVYLRKTHHLSGV